MSADQNITPSAPHPAGPSAASGSVQTAAQELCDRLANLHGLLKALVATAEEKLSAMRSADADRLQQCAATEAELVEQVTAANCLCQAAIAQLAQLLHVPPNLPASASTLAGRLSEPQASILRARIAGLRELADRLQRRNAVAARAAQHLQEHIRAVFAEVAKANRESTVYGTQGQYERGQVRSSVEAVG